MALRETFKIVIDVATDGAQKSLKQLRRDVVEADGSFAKMKVASQGAFGYLRDNAAAVALTAGTALVTFATKSVQAFQDTALAAGQFSDATGIAVEDASRWIEVSGDLGVSADSVQAAMQRMNKSIGDGKPVVDQFADSIVRTADGNVDSAATFQNLVTQIGAIKDPTERAKAAQEMFGRSYGEISRFMEMSASELAAALGGVSEKKVIDPAELEKARKLQASMDALRDTVEDVSLALGEYLVPALSEAADDVVWLFERAGDLSDALESVTGSDLAGWAETLTSPVDMAGAAMDAMTDAIGSDVKATDALRYAWDWLTGNLEDGTVTIESGTDAAADMARMYHQRVVPAIDDTTTAAEDAEQQLRDLDDAYASLTDKLDQEDAWDKFAAKMWEFHSATDRTEAETRDYIRSLGEMVVGLDGVPAETKAKLLAQLDEGDIAVVEKYLSNWRKGVDVPVRFKGQGNVGFDRSDLDRFGATATAGKAVAITPMVAAQPTAAPKDPATAAAMYETGDLSAKDYRAYLDGRLNAYEKYSRDWMSVWRELQSVKDDEKRTDEAAARNEQQRREDAAAAEKQRVSDAYAAAEAQQELADATAAADEVWSQWMDNLKSDPGNWKGNQGDLNERFADALLRRADAQANAQGIADGSIEWARFVRDKLEQDKKNAPILAAAIDALLKGIPVLHSGGVFRSAAGEGLALLQDGETVRTRRQERQLEQRATGQRSGDTITVNLYGTDVTAGQVVREIAWQRMVG